MLDAAVDISPSAPFVIERQLVSATSNAVFDETLPFGRTSGIDSSGRSVSLHVCLATGADTSVIALREDYGDPLAGFETLQIPGWDGEDAKAIAAETLQVARDVLAKLPFGVVAPEAAPGVDGSIGLEWEWQDHRGSARVFIDVLPGRRIVTFVRDTFGDTQERVLYADDSALRDHLRELFARADRPQELAA